MINHFCKYPLWECNKDLIAVAQGSAPADLVIKHARLVSTTTAEILEDTDIAIAKGRVAYLGIGEHTADHCISDTTKVIDAQGAYVAPGFMDGHIHVESSMVGPSEYARGVVPHGTTGIYWDPHEAMNVLGLTALKELIKDSHRVPLKCMITPGSCVPAVPGFEDTGSKIDADDIRETMGWDEVVGLGEMMNDPGVLACEKNPLAEIDETLKAGKVVTGHFTVPDTDRLLDAYIASGVTCCHESTRPEDVTAKIRMGQYALMREGSAWHNLKDLSRAIVGKNIDTRLVCLISDDNHPKTIVSEGHLDRILKMAVELGIDPISAIQMVTINVAQCFEVAHEMGSLTPGKCADMVFLEDLKNFRVTRTIIDGEIVAENGKALFDVERYAWPESMFNSMHVTAPLAPENFDIPAVHADGTPITDKSATVRVMTSFPGQTIIKEEHLEVAVKDGKLCADPEHDILKAFVFERHHSTGTFAAGFAKGFGVHGALAQTVAHDAHNLLVVGDNNEDMARAAQVLCECGGGEVAVVDGEVLGLVKLPVLGLMSADAVEEVAEEVRGVEEAWKKMGCTMPSPFMTMGLLSLACIPDLRLTNRGYVDCNEYRFVPIVVE
ncbi:MAG: adenine deaminase [Atopobiaceae bacterium]|jgi:adenine deaminase